MLFLFNKKFSSGFLGEEIRKIPVKESTTSLPVYY
jgi:hypothetical protein